MPYLTPATLIGLYAPFHCISDNPSPNAMPPHSLSSSSSSTSMSSLRSIQSINRILSARRQRHQHRRSASMTSVLPPTTIGETVMKSEDEYGDDDAAEVKGRRMVRQDMEGQQRKVENAVGIMEPRPQEVVGWGIGEVLWGGRQ